MHREPVVSTQKQPLSRSAGHGRHATGADRSLNDEPGDDTRVIIDIELSDLYRRIDGLGYHLELTPEAKDYVTTKGYDVQFGARPLKRAIQKYIEDELAEIVLLEDIQPGDTITLGYDAATDRMTHTVLRPAVDEAPPAE